MGSSNGSSYSFLLNLPIPLFLYVSILFLKNQLYFVNSSFLIFKGCSFSCCPSYFAKKKVYFISFTKYLDSFGSSSIIYLRDFTSYLRVLWFFIRMNLLILLSKLSRSSTSSENIFAPKSLSTNILKFSKFSNPCLLILNTWERKLTN